MRRAGRLSDSERMCQCGVCRGAILRGSIGGCYRGGGGLVVCGGGWGVRLLWATLWGGLAGPWWGCGAASACVCVSWAVLLEGGAVVGPGAARGCRIVVGMGGCVC